MRPLKPALAVTELLLIVPAALFMAALFVRNLLPASDEPTSTAHRIVMWYSARPGVGLWGFLITLPLAVLVVGGATLLFSWERDPELREAARQTLARVRAHLSTFVIAAATLLSAGILAIVALHMLMN